PYSYIRSLAMEAQVFRDPLSRAPWIFDGQNFWTYEDPVSIQYKASFAARQHLHGVMIWDLSGDTPEGELLESAWKSLRHPLPTQVFVRPRQPESITPVTARQSRVPAGMAR